MPDHLRSLPTGRVRRTAKIGGLVGGAEFHPVTVCAACRAPVGAGELTVKGGTYPVQGNPW